MLNDIEIIEISKQGAIKPFAAEKLRDKNGISYGLEPCGYTMRLGDSYVRTNGNQVPHTIYMKEGDAGIDLKPNILYLLSIYEYLSLPTNVAGYIYPKSTWCRTGLLFLLAPIEPGFKGNLTIAVRNTNSYAVFLPVRSPLVQVQFVQIRPPLSQYTGGYSNQEGQAPVSLLP